DGQTLITGSNDQTARLWNVATGDLVRIFKGHTSSVAAVAFAPDGKSSVTGSSDHSVVTWDFAREPGVIKLPTAALKSEGVAFMPDGVGLISVGPARAGHSLVEILDVSGHKVNSLLHGVPVGISSADFSPDGKTLAVGETTVDDLGREIVCQLWDVEKRQVR